MRSIVLVLFAFILAFPASAQKDTSYLNLHSDTIYVKKDKEQKHPRSHDKKLRPQDIELMRNTISFNALDLMLRNISFNIEFFPGSGKTSISVPLTFYSPLGPAIQDVNSSDLGRYNHSLTTQIRSGFEWNYYPYGQKRWSYYTGLGIQAAYLKRAIDVEINDSDGVYQGLYFYFLGKSGVTVNVTDHFCLGLEVHAGVKTPDLQKVYFAMLGAVNVGVKF